MTIGTIIYSATDNAPGYMPCHGQSLNRDANASLFYKIGTAYGAMDEWSFSVPDLRPVVNGVRVLEPKLGVVYNGQPWVTPLICYMAI